MENSQQTSTTLTEKYKEILLQNGITDKVKHIKIQESGAKGDGFASITHCVTVEFDNDAERKPLQLFVKIHTDNPSHEQFLTDLMAFEKESEFFMKYVPKARKLCEQNGLDDLMNIYPKCYYGDKSIIVLENLALEQGFEMFSWDKRHEFEKACLVLNSLAKHHAISHAMISECGGGKQFCEKFISFKHDAWMSETFIQMIERFFENCLPTNITIVEKNIQALGNELVDKLNSFSGKSRKIFIDSLKLDESEKLRVLTHGDFKNNNMMFRNRQDINEKLEHIIIDFQIISYNVPSLDIALYLYSSVNNKVRQSRLHELLHNYLAAFNKICDDLGHPADFSNEELLFQYKRKAGMGFLNAFCMVGPGMSLMKTSEGMDVNEMNMDDLTKIFHKNLLEWIAKHPEKGKEMTEEIVSLVDEYESLSRK